MEHETYLERIKKLKSAKKITNEKLAEMTGIPLGTLSKLLAGISDSPKLVNMVAISQALGCSLDYLITGEPDNTHNYTLEPAEITLVETFRSLDDYGRRVTALVMESERERTVCQLAETARLQGEAQAAARAHARLTARQTRGRGRRTAEGVVAEHNAAASVAVAAASTVAATVGETVDPISAAPAAAILAMPNTVGETEKTMVAERPALTRASTGLGRRRVLLYDLPVSAGTGVFLDDSVGTEIFIPDAPRTREADFALRIAGDSMEPKYHSGDVLLVQNCENVEEGELGIFMLDGAGYFKKYGGDCLLSLNPAYPPIMLKDFDEAACFGRVVGKLKRK